MDKQNARIRRIVATGEVSTVPADFSFNYYDEINTDAGGNLTALFNTDIYRLAPDGSRTLVTSYPPAPGSYGPRSITVDSQQNLFVLLQYRNSFRVSEVSAANTSRSVHEFMTFGGASRIAADTQGNLAIGTYAPTPGTNQIRFVPRSIQPAAADAPGVFSLPVTGTVSNLAYDAAGNLYAVLLDYEVTSTYPSSYRVFGMRVIRVAPDRTVTTIASGLPDGSASYTWPTPILSEQVGLAIDASGNIYLGNPFNHAIYRVNPSGGYTLIAGKPGEAGNSD
jgi:hypothetical protein